MSARPSSTSRSRTNDIGHAASWNLAVAAGLINWSEVPTRGRKILDSECELVVGLARAAAKNGPLDPQVRGSRDRWLEDILPRVLLHQPDFALSAARVWKAAFEARPGASGDLPASSYAMAIISLVAAGDAKGFERWCFEGRGEAEAEGLDDDRAWISVTIEALGLRQRR